METVILVIHLMLALGITGLVLIQRSDGGLGLSGSGGMGSAAGAAQTANVLTRTTAILAVCFIVTSLTLSILAGRDGSLLDKGTDSMIQAGAETEAKLAAEDARKAADELAAEQQKQDAAPQPAVPQSE